MPRFFQNTSAKAVAGDHLVLSGSDAAHIRRSLRMNVGDELVVCNGNGWDMETVIENFADDAVVLMVKNAYENKTEPSLKVTLYQGLPKGDKFETIIQKTVELGVTEIIPVMLSRCIAKPGDKIKNKVERWQKIADEAAGQSGRGMLPKVSAPISFEEALKQWQNQKVLVCYEKGGQPLGESVCPQDHAISIVVGPEGGISPDEIQKMTDVGVTISTMGPRILRTETAPIAALAVLMERSGNWI